MVRTIVAKEKLDCDHLLGQFLDESHYDTLIEEDTDFYIPAAGFDQELTEDRVGFIFRKNRFSLEEQLGAYEGLHKVANGLSNNRGLASGPRVEKIGNRDWLTACQWEIIEYLKKGKTPLPGFDPIQEILDKHADKNEDATRGCMWLIHSTKRDNFVWSEWLEGVRSKNPIEQQKEALHVEKEYISLSTYASPVHSGVAGSMDRYPRIPYARHCAYNKDNLELFEKSWPFLQNLSSAFKEYLPQRWANQKEACDSIAPEFSVPGTVFTTITVNKIFRTSCHKDAGDLERGFSNLSVLTDGKNDFTGGHLILPEYRCGIAIRPGDLLLIANHNIMHGNSEINGNRLSIVCYFREGLLGTGSYEYELARAEYVELRRKDPILSAGKTQYNGVESGMFEEQQWYDFCISKVGKEETYRNHPNAKPKTESSLSEFF